MNVLCFGILLADEEGVEQYNHKNFSDVKWIDKNEI